MKCGGVISDSLTPDMISLGSEEVLDRPETPIHRIFVHHLSTRLRTVWTIGQLLGHAMSAVSTISTISTVSTQL